MVPTLVQVCQSGTRF